MIAHAVTGSGFKGVVSYLETGHEKDAPERVEWSEARNLATDNPKMAASIMRHTANQSVRCKKPVYHLSISWPEGDKITQEHMREIADKTLSDIGLAEHQALYVAHNDTEHKHVHIVVNRVHPETGKAWSTSHDRKRIMQSLRKQEKERGLQYVPNRLTDKEQAKDMQPSPTRGEAMRARRTGEDPRKRITPAQVKKMRQDLTPVLAGARSWSDLDAELKTRGFRMEPKGPGYIITDGKTYTTFSSLGQAARRADLEQRFNQTRKAFDQERQPEKERKLAAIKEAAEKRRKQKEAEKALQKEMGQSLDFDPGS